MTTIARKNVAAPPAAAVELAVAPHQYETAEGPGGWVVRLKNATGTAPVFLGPAGLAADVNEVQTVTISGAPTGGTFTLTFEGQTTSPLAFNATAADVQAALEALSTIGTGNVTVSGAGPYVVTFVGTLAAQNVALMTAAHAFTGGTAPAIAVAETTAGSGGGYRWDVADGPLVIELDPGEAVFGILAPSAASQMVHVMAS